MSYANYTQYSVDPLGRPRFFGVYKGIVVNNSDPSGANRLQISVPQITGDDYLNWAEPSLSGTVNVPSVGDTVWVAFESGDTSYPVWISGPVSNSSTISVGQTALKRTWNGTASLSWGSGATSGIATFTFNASYVGATVPTVILTPIDTARHVVLTLTASPSLNTITSGPVQTVAVTFRARDVGAVPADLTASGTLSVMYTATE